MNLVKDIMDQFSGDFIGKLGSLLNADEDSVSQATSTAVPALLAGLSSLTSSGEGARRVTDVLSGIGSSGMNDVDSMLRGDADAMESRGTDLLSTLFGGNMLANLGGALGKSSGLTGGVMRKLLAFLAPIVLGKVAAAWNNKGGTVQALTNLMSEQRSHINEALPASFSLANIPGWSTAKAAPATMANSGRRVSESVPAAPRSAASWAIPLLLGALGVFLLWNFMKPRADETAQVDRDIAAPQEVTVQKPVVDEATPAMDATQISDDLRRIFTRAEDALAEIKDSSSPTAAQTKLEELETQIDDMKIKLDRLPASGLATVRETADTSLATLRENAQQTLEMPGLPAEIKSLIESILQKLAALFTPAQP